MNAIDKFDPRSKPYTVTFSKAPPKRCCEATTSFVQEILSRISVSSLRTAWNIGRGGDFSRLFKEAWKNRGAIPAASREAEEETSQPRREIVTEVSTLEGTVYITADPTVMRAVLKYSRKSNDDDELFYDRENTKLLINNILKELYPEDIEQIGLKRAADLLVVTAATPHAALLRKPFATSLGKTKIEGHAQDLRNIADEILTNLTESEKREGDTVKLSYEYAVTVVSKLFTHYGSTRADYQKVADALDAFSRKMTRVVARRPATAQEKREFEAAQNTMKEVVEQCLSNPSPFVQDLIDDKTTPMTKEEKEFQLKAYIFFLFFGGVETTASAMNRCLLELAKNNNLQKQIRDPQEGSKTMLQVAAESLRMQPPAFILGRSMRDHTLMTVRDENNEVILKKELRQGHSLVLLPQAAALDPDLYINPEDFNPHRFNEPQIPQFSFLPFGDGAHYCVGRYLALAELQIFPARLLHHYSMKFAKKPNSEETISPTNPEPRGFFTLRTDAIKVKLTPRSS